MTILVVAAFVICGVGSLAAQLRAYALRRPGRQPRPAYEYASLAMAVAFVVSAVWLVALGQFVPAFAAGALWAIIFLASAAARRDVTGLKM